VAIKSSLRLDLTEFMDLGWAATVLMAVLMLITLSFYWTKGQSFKVLSSLTETISLLSIKTDNPQMYSECP